jgi:hypothetical protein
MGSKLISKEYLEENNFDGLEKHILQVIENIKIAKKDG